MTIFLAVAIIVLILAFVAALICSLIVTTLSPRFGFAGNHRTRRRAAIFLLDLVTVPFIAQPEAT